MFPRALLLLTVVAAAQPPLRAQLVDPLPDIPQGSVSLRLSLFASGLPVEKKIVTPVFTQRVGPTDLAHVPGGTGQLVVTTYGGFAYLLDARGTVQPDPFLDLRTPTSPAYSPQFEVGDAYGLTAIAFHPDFADPTKLGYRKSYTLEAEAAAAGEPNFAGSIRPGEHHQDVLYEYTLTSTSALTCSPQCVTSKRQILRVSQPGWHHNLGDLAFDDSGLLYISSGDGSTSGTTPPIMSDNAQLLTNVFGKILRIDPLKDDGPNGAYGIPADNPLIDGPGPRVDEIYAYGLRNPYRIEFAQATGQLYATETGENQIENVERIVAGGNYGWNIKEGSFLYDKSLRQVVSLDVDQDGNGVGDTADLFGLVEPLFEYDHGDGRAIVGAVPYEGQFVPGLWGNLLFADLTGPLFYGDLATGKVFRPNIDATGHPVPTDVHSVNRGADGELYLLRVEEKPDGELDGLVVKIHSAPASDGDFNSDGQLSAADIDQLAEAVRAGQHEPLFDLTNDWLVDESDHAKWIHELKQTYAGDSNLDGQFDSSDLVLLFRAGQYDDSIPLNSSWATGDWNGDGEFDSGDLVDAFREGGYERGPRPNQATVPEPAEMTPLVCAALVLSWFRKRQRSPALRYPRRALRAPTRLLVACCFLSVITSRLAAADEPRFDTPIDVHIPHITTDPSVVYDYPIVYVRARRAGDQIHKRYYTDFSQPVTMDPGADLILLEPDGTEELLVEGGKGSITDPIMSFDGKWCYYVHIYNLTNASQWNPPGEGADIYKIHLSSRKIVRLTNQRFSPNTGAANWTASYRRDAGESHDTKTYYEYGVYNMGPCPLPGGRVVFTSNRDGFRPSRGYPAIALQLFVMDDRDESIGPDQDPANLEKIGQLNIAGALHPVVLTDGRIMFSTLESQGIRSEISWGIWTIHPDGTNWSPLVSAFDPGGAANGFHFQTQISDGTLVIEQYYNQNNSGFGAYIKMPPRPWTDSPAFGPAYMNDQRNQPWRFGRFDNGRGKFYRMPFMPTGAVSMTPFALNGEGPADFSVLGDQQSPRVGKFTHPSGAPDNHMLTVYSPGPVNHQYTFLPQLDGGIYLAKHGDVIDQPAELRLIKNDPNYNESWPRAVVPYQRIYGVNQPQQLEPLANDGTISRHLPEGTPFGLVGTSTLYKRESYPNGVVHPGELTARCPDEVAQRDPWKGLDSFTSHGNGMPLNFHNQGGDVGLYENDQIVAIRILAMEPTTDRQRGANSGRLFFSHAMERLRILGEVPVRKFELARGTDNLDSITASQPLDPDGNPDTSFLAKIPADTAFTFQTLDKDGLMLNMSQTWHQLRPGEVRNNCGGCHAHSQSPTLFELTRAASPDYTPWNLTTGTPLLTSKQHDESNRQWNADDTVGLTTVDDEVVNVEYFRDIQPIFQRSCVACHTDKRGKEPTGNLNLDADDQRISYEHYGEFPGTYYRLALDERAQFGHKPFGYDSYGYPNASRYIRKLQARRSLLVWKLFGRRLDGFSNDDHPSPVKVGDRYVLVQRGQQVDAERHRAHWDLDYTGSQMPPPRAVEEGIVAPLTDEDRRTILRWIDLGCPIDLDYSPDQPDRLGYGWMLDDNRPILTVTCPKPGRQSRFDRILIGMHDYYSGLDLASLDVRADFAVDGMVPGINLAQRFVTKCEGVRELRLSQPITHLERGTLTVRVQDRQGNTALVQRTFRVQP